MNYPSNPPPARISLYQPEQEGLTFPQIPTFATVTDERQHRKQRLVAACRAFARHGFGFGFGGHLTVRDPEFPDLYWTNPMAVPFSQVRLSNLVLANHAGEVVEGRHSINKAGYVYHTAVHAEHPEIIAMCHAHTFNAGVWCSFGRKLDPINQDACVFYGDQVVISSAAGAVGLEKDTGRSVASQIGNHSVVIHQNHGVFTVSRHSVDDAAFRFIAFDRTCAMQMAVEASGIKPQLVDDDKARYSFEHLGSAYISWLNFETLYQELVLENPDMFL